MKNIEKKRMNKRDIIIRHLIVDLKDDRFCVKLVCLRHYVKPVWIDICICYKRHILVCCTKHLSNLAGKRDEKKNTCKATQIVVDAALE